MIFNNKEIYSIQVIHFTIIEQEALEHATAADVIDA